MKPLLLTLLAGASAERAKRIPYGGTSSFPTFFSAAKASFGNSGGAPAPASSYPAPAPAPSYPAPAPAPSYPAPAPAPSYPAPAPAPSYPAPAPATSYPAPAPAPSYPAPASSYPAPSYQKREPSHNCSVQQERLQATVCLPAIGRPDCGPVTLRGVQVGEQEKCLSITRTVCSVSQEKVTQEVCTIEYTPEEVAAEATLVEVTFSKECTKQMVTVCQPGYHRQGYGYSQENYQKCDEIAQETCYNRPTVGPKPEQVSVRLPTPRMTCSAQTFSLPTVACQDLAEERCVKLPSLEAAEVAAEQCTVGLGEPACRQVELSLPVQVCREQVYGEAHKARTPGYPPPAGYSV